MTKSSFILCFCFCITAACILCSCEDLDLGRTGACENISFETNYTETIKSGENSSDHPVFCPFSTPLIKATISFDANNLYGSMRPDCDGDWNKTMGFILPGSDNPHDNSARFVHRVSADFKNIELGYYVHRNGIVAIRDSLNNIVGSENVDDLVSGYIMDVELGKDYTVLIKHVNNTVEFYIDGGLAWFVDVPNVSSSGDYNSLHFYHGGDCSAPQEVSMNIRYHKP
ncbi:MAG: hypothetical protein MRY83_10410 [Flavobacteriales bacterium]|nr:hypothetical protein [Flavobacteriales bacterium]